MDCRTVEEKLYDCLYGLLDETERGELKSHVAGCSRCQEALERARKELALLKHWDVPAPPEALAAATVASLSRRLGSLTMPYKAVEPEMAWLGGWRFWRIAAAAVFLVAVCLAGLSLWVMTRQSDSQEALVYGQNELTPGLPAAYRVYVRDGRTMQPVSGARVRCQLVSAGRRTFNLGLASTDEQGMAVVEAQIPAVMPEGNYTLRVLAGSEVGKSEVSQTVEVKRSFRVLVTTDKPLYQPGQTIHIRTLSLATADMRPVAAREIVIEVQDGKGNKVFKRKLTTSDYGIASADFQLADQVNTGSYQVSATVGDSTSERSVKVEHYVLPKFKVELGADRGFYLPAQVVKGNLSAQYTFGKAVSGGKVTVTACEYIEKFRPFATAEGQTDRDGDFHFEIPLKDHFVGQDLNKGDALVTLEAAVTDGAGHTEKKTITLSVTANPIRVELFPESGALVQGVPNILYIVTAYPDGRPARTRLTIGATRQQAETSELGVAKVQLTPRGEEMQLTVVAEDDQGLRVEVTRELRIGSRSESILLRTDRAVYKASQTANVTVLSADSTARIFLDVVKDRRTMLMQTLDVEGGKGACALDLPPDLFGTVELHAYRIMPDGNMVRDTRLIQVNRADDLSIGTELDRETYRPGQSALLKFIVTNAQGGPVQAALGIAGVDEAVFARCEMLPGLEQVYFAIQEEVLKPRYELHATAPVTPVELLAEKPERKRELEEAAVVLFSTAQEEGLPGSTASQTWTVKGEALREMQADYLDTLRTGVALVPFGLSVLLALPLLLYALAKLFRRRPLEDVLPDHRERLGQTVKSLNHWWIVGLYLPFVLAFLGLLMADAWRAVSIEETLLVFGGVGIAALLALFGMVPSVWRLQRTAVSRAVPLLRRFSALLPASYLAGVAGFVAIMFVAGFGSLDSDVALLLLGLILLVEVLVVGAIAIAQDYVVGRLSVGRWFWLAISRPLAAALPAFLIAGFLLPSLGKAQESARRASLTGAAPQLALMLEAGWTDGGTSAPAEVGPASAAPSKAGTAVPVRRYFPETLLWRPEVITDEAGRAQLQVPLADSITTWRLAMSAVSKAGELGSATKGLRVFQDFFVDIDFPVALTQHDVVSVPVAVFNYLAQPQTVRLELEATSWCTFIDPPVRTIQVQPGEVTGVSFRIQAMEAGPQKLLVKAAGSKMSDAVERQVMVEPDGKAFVQTVNGSLGDNVTQTLVIPEDAIDGALDMVVKVYPGAFSQVVEGLDSIFQMPYGCFEQTSSVTYPNVLVLDYMRRSKQIKPEVEMKALNFINLGYQRLVSYEVKDGGFSWFGQPPAHNVLTAYGLMEFADMSKVYDVDPKVIERTRQWLYSGQGADGSWQPTPGGIAEGAINGFQGQVLRTTAYIACALSETGKSEASLDRALAYLASKSQEVKDAYTLALCANAFVAAGRSEAGPVLDRLEQMKTQEGKLVHWGSSGAEGVMHSRGQSLDIETTALAARALLAARRHTDTAHKALAWLIENKDPRGTWHSTQATVQAMRALLAGSGAAGGVEKTTRVTVAANGKVAGKLEITPETGDVFRLVSLKPFVHKGENVITLEANRETGLAYQVVATHYLPWPRESTAQAEKEMTIDVDYDTTTLKRDDLLTCTVTVSYNRPGMARMTIVDLGVPPGFEVLPEAFDQLKTRKVIARYSLTGRQVILYFEEIPGGRPIRFNYQLRAKFPVKVKTPKSTVYQYYQPELRDEAAPVILTIM